MTNVEDFEQDLLASNLSDISPCFWRLIFLFCFLCGGRGGGVNYNQKKMYSLDDDLVRLEASKSGA